MEVCFSSTILVQCDPVKAVHFKCQANLRLYKLLYTEKDSLINMQTGKMIFGALNFNNL